MNSAISVRDGRLVYDEVTQMERQFLATLSQFGPESYKTALALHQWGKRKAKRDHLVLGYHTPQRSRPIG